MSKLYNNYVDRVNIVRMKNQIYLYLVILFFYTMTGCLAAQIIYKSQLKGDFVSISSDGNTIAIVEGQRQTDTLYHLIILKKTANSYLQIKVRNAELYIPSSNLTNLMKYADEGKFKPRFSNDGLQIYYIDFKSGYPVRADLANISIDQPQLVNIYLYGQYCNGSAYFCFYSLQKNHLSIYSQNNSQVSLFSNGTQVRIVLLNSQTCTNIICFSNLTLINFEWDTQLKKITFLRVNRPAKIWGRIDYLIEQGLYLNPFIYSYMWYQQLNLQKFYRSTIHMNSYYSQNGIFMREPIIYLYNSNNPYPVVKSDHFPSFLLAKYTDLIGFSYTIKKINYIVLIRPESISWDQNPLIELQIISPNQILSFDCSSDGTRMVYLNVNGQIFVIDHSLQVEQTLNLTYQQNSTKQTANITIQVGQIQKQISQSKKLILGTIIISLLTLFVILTVLIALFCRYLNIKKGRQIKKGVREIRQDSQCELDDKKNGLNKSIDNCNC